MKQEPKKSPALRFPEFSEGWDFHQLGELIKISSGGTPDRTNQKYWNGNIPWVTTTLIDFKVITAAEEYISNLGLKNSAAKIFPAGTVLMAMYGQGKTRGQVGILGIEATTNQACAALLPDKERIDELFLFQNLAGKYSAIRKLSNSGGQDNLSAQLIRTIGLAFPSLIEQKKIAAFLTSVDEKIQQLARKKELLCKYKTGVMQQIFDQKIRFKDASGNDFPEWEKKPLGDYLIKFDKITTQNNQYPVLTSSHRGLFLQTEYFSGNQIASENNTGYNIVPRGYFTYRHMSDTTVFRFNINDIVDFGIVSTLYPVFTTRQINDEFLKLKLNHGDEFRRFAVMQKQGGSRTYMYFSRLKELEMELPHIDEQRKIAKFFSVLDKKIDLVNQQLQQMKQFKAGLLQQMFV